MKFEIRFLPVARKQFLRLSKDIQKRLDPRILALADDPHPPGSTKLSGQDNRYRIRVGNYRIIYQVENDELVILVVRVGHRRGIYRER